uniref:Uncharacterized protein n=1 Tax=Pseudictyota dubia TaxID=2749911 RepID=A0A7R9ZDI8_9STRA
MSYIKPDMQRKHVFAPSRIANLTNARSTKNPHTPIEDPTFTSKKAFSHWAFFMYSLCSLSHLAWSTPNPSGAYAFHPMTRAVTDLVSSRPQVCNFEFRFLGSIRTSL